MANTHQIVGHSPPRKEGVAKVLGRAQYVDDISLPDMWFGATVRSTIPHGRISSINFGPDIPWHEFTIVSAADIPGENTIVHLTRDHPCLAVTNVNHVEEPILLLAHPDRAVLPAAVAAVHITYEELPAIYTIEESEKKETIIWGEGKTANTFKTYLMQKNQTPVPDEVWEKADYIIEGEYRPEHRSSSTSRTTESSQNTTQKKESRSAGPCNVPSTSSTLSNSSSTSPPKSAGSSKPKPAGPSVARKTSPASSAATPHCSP